MINQNEKSQIKALLQSPQWKTVEQVANELCDKVAYDSKVRDTEWDTLKTTLIDEGQVRGIKRLIQELYNLAL